MLLYITAEDVFGDGAPERRGPEPLHRIPDAVAGLYDLGLRHHVRQAAMPWPTDEGFEPVPDGRTTTAVGETGRADRDVVALRPQGTRPGRPAGPPATSAAAARGAAAPADSGSPGYGSSISRREKTAVSRTPVWWEQTARPT
jgi:hypothetical protein